MLEKGIPAKDLEFRIIKASAPGELQLVIDSFLDSARAQNFTIFDVSFVSRDKDLFVVFFYKVP